AIRVERNGTLDTLDDVIMYSAPTNFSGVDTFKYTITDASGDASTATVTLTVSGPITNVPTAVADSFSILTDATTSFDVLDNDTLGDDVVGSVLTIDATGITGSVSVVPGLLADASDDTLLYTPASGAIGVDTFSYTITDGNGDFSTATVTVNISAVVVAQSDKPEAVDD
ncbi:Ig-like domain-containing protein, partial [Polaribacter glomeratus]|uniref:Ig-like domain-containing protein n=1 Tax=Polaribacter glomeratus TaxID=102 RepID=UPI00147892C1